MEHFYSSGFEDWDKMNFLKAVASFEAAEKPPFKLNLFSELFSLMRYSSCLLNTIVSEYALFDVLSMRDLYKEASGISDRRPVHILIKTRPL